MKHTISKRERIVVQRAFDRADVRGDSRSGCYVAAVGALKELYPDADPAFVAKRAVTILTGEISLFALSKEHS